ncbi:MAG: sulfite exporter TauE/SafE family protein [Alphaproteobacteria bacterium]|nr:sulfite exporter TauE/SafE family protein [Alphaproteobacteria bacterium]
MPVFDIATFTLFALVAGLLIGCVGIGGVTLVPLLAYVGGVPIHTAIAAAMFSYLVSGAIGTFVFARNKSIRWDMTAWMWAGAMPAAFLGALAASAASGWILEMCIGALTAASGLNTLLAKSGADGVEGSSLGKPALAVIGAITGFASSLTGTGGPLVLVPILMWLQLPVLTAIGLSQAIQLPIAVLATAGNLYAGTLDLVLGCVLAAGISIGTWGGARLAHVLPRTTLRKVVSVLMIVIGGLILAKILYGALVA